MPAVLPSQQGQSHALMWKVIKRPVTCAPSQGSCKYSPPTMERVRSQEPVGLEGGGRGRGSLGTETGVGRGGDTGGAAGGVGGRGWGGGVDPSLPADSPFLIFSFSLLSFQTRHGRLICADPGQAWVQRYIIYLNQKSKGAGSSGTFTVEGS